MENAPATNEQVVNDIIKCYGEVINLKENPALIVEIMRQFGRKVQVDGGLPGGVGPVPPGPTSRFETVTNAELMKQILKISKELAVLKKKLG